MSVSLKVKLIQSFQCFSRVVNVSSTVSSWVAAKSSDSLKSRFSKPDLTMSDVEKLMNEFVR